MCPSGKAKVFSSAGASGSAVVAGTSGEGAVVTTAEGAMEPARDGSALVCNVEAGGAVIAAGPVPSWVPQAESAMLADRRYTVAAVLLIKRLDSMPVLSPKVRLSSG